ncbi:MAG: winged helix-turn-helix domain-containing protein [Methanothrix sp.]
MKRSRQEIISQILEICMNGASKTKIVYQANLNFKTVNPYLDLLIKNDLIQVNEKQVMLYETTLKGKSLLKKIQKVHGELSEL